MSRMSREEWYMMIADNVAKRSTCSRAQVGAVLVNPDTKRIVAMGYNGSPKGAKHCIDTECLMSDGHCIRTIHAELNAVLNLEKNYDDLHLYSTHQPCLQCTKVLVGANVSKVFFRHEYIDQERDRLLLELHIRFIKM